MWVVLDENNNNIVQRDKQNHGFRFYVLVLVVEMSSDKWPKPGMHSFGLATRSCTPDQVLNSHCYLFLLIVGGNLM